FQGVLDHADLLSPGIVDGTGVAEALGGMFGAGLVVTQLLVVLMIMALFLAIRTAMAGSSRTLYQGSKDSWLPKYLDHVNEHGAPTR
ncbi:amino acid permease, partial [Rhizobium ruizarguesonis]